MRVELRILTLEPTLEQHTQLRDPPHAQRGAPIVAHHELHQVIEVPRGVLRIDGARLAAESKAAAAKAAAVVPEGLAAACHRECEPPPQPELRMLFVSLLLLGSLLLLDSLVVLALERPQLLEHRLAVRRLPWLPPCKLDDPWRLRLPACRQLAPPLLVSLQVPQRQQQIGELEPMPLVERLRHTGHQPRHQQRQHRPHPRDGAAHDLLLFLEVHRLDERQHEAARQLARRAELRVQLRLERLGLRAVALHLPPQRLLAHERRDGLRMLQHRLLRPAHRPISTPLLQRHPDQRAAAVAVVIAAAQPPALCKHA